VSPSNRSAHKCTSVSASISWALLAILGRARFMMINYRVGEPVQQVGPADDAHKPAVAEHRHALNVMTLQ
jgi:hypothetical protein